MKLSRVLSIFLFVFLSLQVRGETRLQLELSHLQIDYSEKQDSMALSEGDFSQRMVNLRGRGEWMAFSDWLVFGAELDYSTPYSSSKESEFSLLRASTSASLVFNSRPFYLSIVAEQFYQAMDASDSVFGYDSINGYHIFPQLDFSFERGSRFYFKAPLYTSVDQRKLLTAGFELRLGGAPQNYPKRHFQSSIILKLEYQSEELVFVDALETDIRTESLMIGLGYNF